MRCWCGDEFYTDTLLQQTTLRTAAFTQSSSYARMLLHRVLCTEKLLHTDAFTQRLSRKEAFTHRSFYKPMLYTKMILRFYTQTLSQTEAFTQRNLFAQNSFYTKKFSCSPLEKANRYFPKQRGHTEGFLRQELRPGCSIEVVSLAFGIFPVNFHAKWLL